MKSVSLAVPVLVSSIIVAGSLAVSVAETEREFKPVQVVKPFKAIVNAPHVSVDKAAKWVNGDELVLGVSLKGEARAYPINMLTNPTREIINDTLGGRSIAATW